MKTLTAKALSLFDRGIKTFLSDPTTRQGIYGSTKYDPIEEREVLALVCEDHPESNLEVVVGTHVDVMALGVGFGTKAAVGEASFQTLCEKYGVPDTVSCAGATGGHYYFFKHDDSAGFQEESGLKIFADVEGLLVHPMKVEGGLVDEIGSGVSIKGYRDWLDGNSKTAEDVTEDEELPRVPEVALQGPSCDEPATDEDYKPGTDRTVDDVRKPDPVAIVDPLALLRNEINSWVAHGDDKNAVLTKALAWNQLQAEPVMPVMLVGIVEELTEEKSSDNELKSDEEILYEIVEAMTLINDELTEPYFFFEGEAFLAPSRHIENRVKFLFLKKMHRLPKAKDLKDVLSIQESRARFDSPRVRLNNRVARIDDAMVYDLRDKRYIKVTREKWELVTAYPLFRRYQHQQPQTVPVSGGNPWDIFNFLAVEEENRLLVLVYLISLFVPRIAHPVFAVFGDQGSAKSFFCTLINRLVDPTLTERIIQPKNEKDLIQTLRQKYVTVLDNLSKFNGQVSDILCQVCTGGAISFRKLYTDEGENIAQFRHVVVLNSISLPIVNADLMDRSIILKCHRIKPEDRKPEEELWSAFEVAKPAILGGIFDTLVKAMAIYETVNIERLPRLADFAKWGYAIAEALGKSGEQFIDDFNSNVTRQNQSVAEKNVLCQSVLTLMSERTVHLKSVADTHTALKGIARQDAKDSTFPKLPQNMRDGLDKLRSTLLEHGITFQYLDRQSKGFQILISKTDTPDASGQTVEGEQPPKESGYHRVPDEPDVPESETLVFEMEELPVAVNE